MFAAFALGITLVVLAGFVWVVRPLLARIGRLSVAASKVGGDQAELQLAVEHPDELGDVEARLISAHRQIVADREAILLRLADTAHDQRTPLASLQLALGALADKLSQSARRLPQALVTAMADTVYLASLTDNLQLATRMVRSPRSSDDRSEVDLCILSERVCERLGVLAQHRSLSLACPRPDEPVIVAGEALALERAIANLVHNAVRYGEPGGHVTVRLDTADDQFSLVVLDDGPGVPPEDLPNLQTRAFRGDVARRRDVHGEGLGLAIVAEVCARHSFSLDFEAEQPRGLRVTITGRFACSPKPSGL